MKKEAKDAIPAGNLALGEYLISLLPRLAQDKDPPSWPPDVFALCTAAMLRSGAYCTVLADWPPKLSGDAETSSDWADRVSNIGKRWRRDWPDSSVPTEVRELWELLLNGLDVSVSDLCKHTQLCQVLLELCAISDAACVEVGLPHEDIMEEPEFYEFADIVLGPKENGSSLCVEIDPSRARVLPKMRTPRNGLTVRSLSMHLALCTGTELTPKWFTAPSFSPKSLGLNLLLVPWPSEVHPSQFSETPPRPSEMRNMPHDEFGFFTFRQRDEPKSILETVERLYELAESRLGRVDGVILPELAMSPETHGLLSENVLMRGAFLISGVGKPSNPTNEIGTNTVRLDIPGVESLIQNKHHRWRLDTAQIEQYGLGSRLHPERSWWEHISLADRQVMFVSMFPWLVVCPLICEDLARPDPIGDVVRAVGPNLVVALLMDGPQVKERWGARYATALADDPGCSVLTLTSLGMANLSRPMRGGTNRPRVVALWKDSEHGTPVEIELPPGHSGVVLSLTVRYLQEYTADGRDDEGTAGCPVLSGVQTLE